MQYGKFGTDQAERDFRAWTAQHGLDVYWAKVKQQLEKKMKQLFWTAAFYRKGKKTEMVQYPNAELYESKDAARRATIKRIPSSYKERFDRLEVVVRPF